MTAKDADETTMLITQVIPDGQIGVTTSPSQKRNIIAIEGLRTILCTQILIMHACGPPGAKGYADNFLAQRYAHLLNNLQASCHCFLVLSGFVTHLAARSRPAPSTIYGQCLYFGKKWVRFAPIYYLTYVFTLWHNNGTQTSGIAADKTWPAVLTFFGVQSMVPFEFDGQYVPMAFMGHMWFVSTLMFSLFMYPVMLQMIRYFDIAGNSGRTLYALIGCLTIEVLIGVVGMLPGWAMPGGNSYAGYAHFGPIVMFTFLSGVLVAELAQSMSEVWRSSQIWRYADLVCLLFLVFVTPLLEAYLLTEVMDHMLCLAFRPAQAAAHPP